MSLSSIAAIRSAARLLRSGKKDEARRRLARAMEEGSRDHRLVIRLAIASGDHSPLVKAAGEGRAGRAGWIFPAMDRALAGDYSKAGEYAANALDISPENMSARALAGLAGFRRTGDISHLRGHAEALPHAAARIQALILLAVEQAIAGTCPEDSGAEEVEDKTTGPLGRMLDILDDLAIWIYWLISVALNLVINAMNPARRAVYWKVIEGDRLEGLGKDEPAMEQFAMALEMAPGCVEALESMVKHSIRLRRHEQAEEYLARLLAAVGEAGATDPSLLKMRADLAFFQRRHEKALTVYKSLQPQFPLSYIIPYRVGLCLLAGGDVKGAVDKFEKALSQVNPGLLRQRVELCQAVQGG